MYDSAKKDVKNMETKIEMAKEVIDKLEPNEK
jgi:hypothetical protein